MNEKIIKPGVVKRITDQIKDKNCCLTRKIQKIDTQNPKFQQPVESVENFKNFVQTNQNTNPSGEKQKTRRFFYSSSKSPTTQESTLHIFSTCSSLTNAQLLLYISQTVDGRICVSLANSACVIPALSSSLFNFIFMIPLPSNVILFKSYHNGFCYPWFKKNNISSFGSATPGSCLLTCYYFFRPLQC